MTQGVSLEGRPTVFVSSTVRDFGDLRSALKYWLEEMGLRVLMSEFNDFERSPDAGTYESCLAAIEGCDFYILLIGSRMGSEYQEGVSVTQQEYRFAAKLAQERDRPSPIVFVRAEVLGAVTERKELRNRGTPEDSLDIATPALTDPAFIEGFLDEIGATEIARKGDDPSGFMWRYPFRDFSDLVTALRITLGLQRSIRRQALLANLRWELEENIATLCRNNRELPDPVPDWLGPVRRRYVLTASQLNKYLELPSEHAGYVSMFWTLQARAANRLVHRALEQAISSGEFLAYNPQSARLEHGGLYVAMQTLLKRIDSAQAQLRMLETHAAAESDLYAAVATKAPVVPVLGHHLGLLYGFQDCLTDILRLSIALLQYTMDPTAEFRFPTLTPISPLGDMVEAVEAERATHEDVERWASDGYIWRSMTGEDGGTMEEFQSALNRYPYLKETVDEALKQDIEKLRQRLDPEEFQRRLREDGPDATMEWLGDLIRYD